jgi:hypothetical protein
MIDHEYETSPSEVGHGGPLARYEEYLRKELPDLVRRMLEIRIDEALQLTEETLKDEIVDIVRDSQRELFEKYKSTHRGPAEDQQTADGTADAEPQACQSGPSTSAVSPQQSLDNLLQPYRPEPDLDDQFYNVFNGQLFDFTLMHGAPPLADSAYGTLSLDATEDTSTGRGWGKDGFLTGYDESAHHGMDRF